MQKKNKVLLSAVPIAACVAAIGVGAPAAHAAGTSGATTYTANLAAVTPNAPAGSVSGKVTVTVTGDQATVTEKVSGLAAKLPTDKKTLASLGIPAAFAGAPFPHVQHIHINGQGSCPTAADDTNKDGVVSVKEGIPNYGNIGTTLSVKGTTDPSAAVDVTVAPGGANFTYQRTFTLNQPTLTAIKANKAEIVVHGLNPANAPKASLTSPNSLGVTLPGATKKLALIGTAPTLCGQLTASQMNTMPQGSVNTDYASTTDSTNSVALAGGAAAIALGGAGVLLMRRRKHTNV